MITAFRRRDADDWAAGDVVRFQLMITASLSVVFFALLPFAFRFFGAEADEIWTWCSALLGSFLGCFLVFEARRSVPLASVRGLSPLVLWSFIAGGVVAVCLQGLNVAGIGLRQQLGPYFLGLLYLLVLSGVSFARLLPVGRARRV